MSRSFNYVIYLGLLVFALSCTAQTDSISPTGFVESKEYALLLDFRCAHEKEANQSLSTPGLSLQLLKEFDDTDAQNYFKEVADFKNHLNSLPVEERAKARQNLESNFLSKRSIEFRKALRSNYSAGYIDVRSNTKLIAELREVFPEVTIEQLQGQLAIDLKNCK